jgi:LAGLIDADG endonuclease
MIENEIEYRGSKSTILIQYPQPNEDKIVVKEQRVDGSYFGLYPKLRCTLMGCESSYQIKIPSKQFKLFNFNKLFFSTISSNSKLNSYFVSGLIDAEGSFSIIINKDIRYKTGWHVRSLFQIVLHSRDSSLLYQLQEFFDGIGTFKIDKRRNVINYSVASLKDLTNIIISHFKKYPLLTQKAADFNLFEQTIELMNKGAHLTIDGLQQIINIKASMNLGLSDILKSEFNNFNPVERPLIITHKVVDPFWVSGFVSGEGNFDVGIKKKLKNKIGYEVYLRFRITQHKKDKNLMELIINYLGAGRLEIQTKNPVVIIVISKISDINQKIIPFFNQFPICGIKTLDYLDWCKVAKLITNKSHLTNEGLEEIRKIKSGMNANRIKK